MGEEDNTKTSYSHMFKLRIHLTENEQKPFNGHLQESVTHWATFYPFILASFLFKNLFKNKTNFLKKQQNTKKNPKRTPFS